jgi:ATP-binding cassette subfamily B protein
MPAPEPTELPDSHIVLRLLRVSWSYRARSLAVFGLQMLLLVMTMAGLTFSGVAVDVVRKALDPSAADPRWPLHLSPAPGTPVHEQLWWLGAFVLGAALARGALTYTYSLQAATLVHEDIVPSFRRQLFRRLQRLSFRFFDVNATGSIINRVTRDVQLLRSFVDGVLVQGAVLLLSLSVFLAYMLSVHVELTLVCLALTPLIYLATLRFSRWARPAYRKNRELADDMVRAVAEGIEGTLVTKVFGREQEQYDRFQEKSLAVKDQQLTIFKAVSRFTPGIDLLTQLNVLILLLYGGALVIERRILLGDLVVFAGLLQQFASRASGMSTIVNTLQQSLTGARRVFEVLDAPLEVQSPESAIVPEPGPGHVEFRNVSFGYRPGEPVLCDIELDVAPGECVGVLGLTGAGKSTLLSLVGRFYDPSAGQVRLDGRDLRDYDVDELRKAMGIVFQENLLFRDSVYANIAYGEPSASPGRVREAARLAGALGFIERLPQGFDSVVHETGINLSGGQRQRIAIARALLLEPKVLLFDDPTTAVDPETEREVLSAIRAASSGRTTLIVSNRLSTLRYTDRVLVLEQGRIAEQGSHHQLMQGTGLYRKAAELQTVDSESLRLLRELGAAE